MECWSTAPIWIAPRVRDAFAGLGVLSGRDLGTPYPGLKPWLILLCHLTVRTASLLAPSSLPLFHRDLSNVNIHLTVCAFSDVLDLERTVVQSGHGVTLLGHIAPSRKLYDDSDTGS
jgi:hypothetical protein